MVNLVSDEKLLDNRGPKQTISSLWTYVESLRFFPVIQSHSLSFGFNVKNYDWEESVWLAFLGVLVYYDI